MTRDKRLALILGAAAVLFALGIGLAVGLHDESSSSSPSPTTALRGDLLGLNLQTYTGTYDADTQYLGPCAVVTPPNADPCVAAQQTIRYVLFGAAVNADLFKKWKAANPGEYARLTAHMNAPACSQGAVGQPQDMLTQTGAMFYAAVQAYACALGTEPIAWPVPNPPRVAGAKDKTPPSAPGPITVQP